MPRLAAPLVLALLSLAGCGLRRAAVLPADPAAEERIRGLVAARLGAEPSLAGSTIRVLVERGTVLLHGRVRGMGAWQCALTNAALVPGVESVVDYLVLERGPRDVRCLAPRQDPGAGTGPT